LNSTPIHRSRQAEAEHLVPNSNSPHHELMAGTRASGSMSTASRHSGNAITWRLAGNSNRGMVLADQPG